LHFVSSTAALTNEYASIPEEMSKVAAHFGKKVLREVKEEDLLADLAQVRKEAGDRAVLRALHFYADDRRAAEEAEGVEDYDYIVINDEVDLCVGRIHDIVLSEKMKAKYNLGLINNIKEELKVYSKGE